MTKQAISPPSTRLRLSVLGIALALTLVGLAAPRGVLQPTAAAQTPPTTTGEWEEVERLVSEDKVQEAVELAARLRATAQAAGDDEGWTRGLILEVQLRTALHGYETAVRHLRAEPWPETPRHRVLLNLVYAQSLVHYYQAYSWEIQQRERVTSDDDVDLKAWTRGQLFAAANGAFLQVWEERASWQDASLETLGDDLAPNDYPRRIRGTLRDAVTYLWVELLADTTFWSPEEGNETFRLSLERLADGEAAQFSEVELAGNEDHPLIRIAAILADLEGWHQSRDRPEAAFEARRERLVRLWNSLSQDTDQELLKDSLRRGLDTLSRRYEWWSMGMATLAEWVRSEPAPDSLVRARSLALMGERAYPESIPGRLCRHIVAAIEAPDYNLSAMASDGPGKRSIVVEHRNLPQLYLRAYAVDLREQIRRAEDYTLLPDGNEIERLLSSRTPTAEWQAELAPTPDFRSHRSYVTLPAEAPGLYTVVASADPTFEASQNRRTAVNLIVGDLVLVTRMRHNAVEVTAHSGRSGEPVPGASIHLHRHDWRRGGHRQVETATTGADGRAELPLRSRRHSYFLLGESGDELALDPQYHHRQPIHQAGEETTALAYTDRSVYRPGQALLWKVIAYRGGGRQSRFRTLPDHPFEVELRDANGEVVASQKVTSNAFGSAAGEFELPRGRILGRWSVHTSLGSRTRVQVEEYKRPTFEVTLSDPSQTLRLNRTATLSGEARYYFGLPVSAGEVDWQVTRESVYPYWWSWYGRPSVGSQTVAGGRTLLGEDGRFEVTFTPEADERQAAEGITFRYRLSVAATDEGGETRSAERVFHLGFVAVSARLSSDAAFFLSGEPVAFEIRRTDLDGVGRQGVGSWRIVALESPPEALLPADEPLPEPPRRPGETEPYRTPGDRLRPRFESWSYSPEATLHRWSDGDELATGEVTHGGDGRGEVQLPAGLRAGAYRLRYTTRDPFGAELATAKEFLVAEAGFTALPLPALLLAERSSAPVGETARILVHSGLKDQPMVLELYRGSRPVERRLLNSREGMQIVEIPLGPGQRGGFGVTLAALRDHQLMSLHDQVFVPWDDRELELEFSTFRDRLRPGQEESWRITVRGADEAKLGEGAAELLAYMYDRSLDLFAPHSPPSPLAVYPRLTGLVLANSSLGHARPAWWDNREWGSVSLPPTLEPNRLRFFSGYGIGGLGVRFKQVLGLSAAEGRRLEEITVTSEAPLVEGTSSLAAASPPAERFEPDMEAEPAAEESPPEAPPATLREDFSETAFWRPHLLTGVDGSVSFEFTVPDSVTEWNVWVHALTRDLRAGSLQRQVRTVKELLVRPYLPRFLREGDHAELKVVIHNAGSEPLEGELSFEILDPETDASLLREFGLTAAEARELPFAVDPGASTNLTFAVATPIRVGTVALRAVATAGDFSDGELRPLPLLPGRIHLSQSRFAALKDRDRRRLEFADLRGAEDDPTLITDQLVVTLEAQLFYGVLNALPYLVDYPYECTEQTLNRFVSAGIVSRVFESYPAVARMARQLSERESRLAPWDETDPNRGMTLVETPWLAQSRGEDSRRSLIKVLDPKVAAAERRSALAKLRRAQTSLGAFPWWPGGPPSPYMTLYILNGLSRALEHEVEVPKEMVQRAWGYLERHYAEAWAEGSIEDHCCLELVTFLNYVLSTYPDESWTGGVFTAADRERMLDLSWRRWRDHPPLLKAQLALTLERAGRGDDAALVFDSVMDSSRTTRDLGTFWAPEDRAWLWYNDTVESHAWALRTLTELDPSDERRHGLVQWLFLNRKLNHWKSTRATAEAIYALVRYLEEEGALGVPEAATVRLGPIEERFDFAADRYTGASTQLVVPGSEVDPKTMSTVVVEKETPGFLFASATWHFSTEELPEEARGDFFSVGRRYFKRVHDGQEWTLEPLAEGDRVSVGDQVEVQLSLKTQHAAEYVHLRDPRGAGFEPESVRSQYRWDLGIAWFEEVRDSGTNFFFDWLPAGEYTFRYRLRANLAGRFRVGPATIQSMYAPEFTGYSAGATLEVGG